MVTEISSYINIRSTARPFLSDNMADLRDKVVLIFGATGGVGSRTAVELVGYGPRLALHGRDTNKLQQTADKCTKLGLSKNKILTVTGDVTKPEDVQAVISTTVSRYGQLDVVIHAAGSCKLRNLWNCSVEDLDWTYSTITRSAFIITKAAIPHLEKTGGNIVHVSALAGMRPHAFSLPFSLASAGRDQFTKAASIDLARKGIRLNSVNLNVTNSDFFSNSFQETYNRKPTTKEIREQHELCSKSFPAGRIATVDEVARTIVFLVSDQASFIAGATIAIDGSYFNVGYAGAKDKSIKHMDLSHKSM